MPANKLNVCLAPWHKARLSQSGVIDAVVDARHYETAATKICLEQLGFSRNQCVAPALVIPLYNHLGEQVGVQIRPDKPRLNREAKPIKYESPVDSYPVIDIPPAARQAVLDYNRPLVITEGVIKADSAVSKGIPCVSIAGVFAWRPDDPFWAHIPLSERIVYVAFDSDQATNPNVQKAAVRLSNEFRRHGAVPKVLCLPPGENAAKQGLDDFLVSGHTPQDLFALPCLDVDSVSQDEQKEAHRQYRMTPRGLVREYVNGNDVEILPLTNFNAWIIVDNELDDGVDIRHEFDITVELQGTRQVVSVTADEFERMSWVLTKVGGNAIVGAGIVTRDHARAAIQSVSGAIPRRKLYEHLGWVKIANNWAFLHAGGAIGTDVLKPHRSTRDASVLCNPLVLNEIGAGRPIGPQQEELGKICGVGVRIPDALKHYNLPDPISGDELKEAVRDTLFILAAVAPPHLYLILLAATFRIAVDTVDFSIHLVGQTNVGKTVLLGLFTQFFGAELHHRNLPGSWLSTSNSLLGLMALGKNVTLPIDDFVPTGSQSDIDRLNRDAARVFRSQGNQAGRGRCTRDGTPKEGRPPKCLPISTGEDVPEGHSLNSRVLTLEIKADDVLAPHQLKILTLAQQMARRGLFVKVMASFLAWLAPRYEEERQILHEQKEEFREVFRQSGRLPRSVDIAADLLAGLDMFLDFCREQNAISEEKFDDLWSEMHSVLHSILDEQQTTTEEADPVCRYLSLLVTAFTTGYAHLKNPANQVPWDSPYLWGWKESFREVQEKDDEGNTNTVERSYYISLGPQIGWVGYDELYLEIEASLAVVQKLAKDSSLRPLPLSMRSLGKSLAARGFLVRTTKGHYTDKVPILGIEKRVLRISVTKLVQFQGRPDQNTKKLEELLDA